MSIKDDDKVTHTPGPWIITAEEHVAAPRPHPLDGVRLICEMRAVGKADERIANTRLIAAAPDLLAALQDVVRWWETLSDEYADLREGSIMPDKLRAAIAKAEGRS